MVVTMLREFSQEILHPPTSMRPHPTGRLPHQYSSSSMDHPTAFIRRLRSGSILSALLAARLASAEPPAPPTPEALAFFESKIRPVLVDKCYECHSATAKKIKGGLLLDTRAGVREGGDSGAVVAPGDPKNSLLLMAISYQDRDLEMPPKERLSASIVADFEKWIALGAPDPRDGATAPKPAGIDLEAGRRHWSFQPLTAPAVPSPRDTAWARSTIDRFVLAGLEAKNLRPVADAGAGPMLRRIYFDLVGLPPPAEDIDPFAAAYAADPAAAIARLVDRLLASPRFGERWGRHWLDVARYAESSGVAHNVIFPVAFRYRDWVIDAFNRDLPYDQFVRDQLAGDLLPAADPAERASRLTATGFLAVGVKDLRERDVKRYRMGIADEQIDVTSRAFLGLTVACARCHDHKFDPIPTRDYYALAGIFASSEPLLGVRRSRNTHPFGAGLHRIEGDPGSFTEADLAAMLDLRLQLTRHTLSRRDERRKLLMSLGKLKAREEEQEAIFRTSDQLREIEVKLVDAKERSEALMRRFDQFATQAAMGVRDATPADVAIHLRGEDTQLGEIVPRGFLSVLANADTPAVNRTQSGRRELAEWIASPRHPLTARVMANRIWQHLFGDGIVETPDDFGHTGQPPENPALLDHLATRLIVHGWSIKAMIREITTSRVYRLSTDHEAGAHELDPANRLHWRMSRRRLDSDALRDTFQLLGNGLDLAKPAARFLPTEEDDRLKSRDLKTWFGDVARHRTIYQPVLRDIVPDDWNLFDFPNPELVTGRRGITTVPTQALYLMNSPFVVGQSRAATERVRNLPAKNDPDRIAHAFRLILSRPPTAQEQAGAQNLLANFPRTDTSDAAHAATAWAALCQSLFATAEFRYLY
ncbi:MAG: DUF1553 domain-containing protein [Opitutus sp.]|nr:DUF1553 domain-containing protein [Opitutus sp.]